jgi:hypothetical protein
MKMKTYIAPFMALMIIGLLVITGCQGFLEPPVSVADRSGVLIVSVNGLEGRTILPQAKLDKYVVTITNEDTDAVVIDGQELTGSKSFELAAGTYTVSAEGYVDGVVIAEGEETGVIVGTGATSVNIILEAVADPDINGTFSWDFSDVEGQTVTRAAIKIYAIDDDDLETDLLEDHAALEITDEVYLPGGVYNVKITLTVDVDGTDTDFSWWEILYIYSGLTSFYDASDVGARSVLPTIPYEVLAGGYGKDNGDGTFTDGFGYFYLDLNNWKKVSTSGDSGVDNTPVTGATAEDSLTVQFTKNNQRVNIGLTAAQVNALLASAGPIEVTVIGGATPNTTEFRYFLGDPSSGSGWNSTSGSGQAAFSGLADTEANGGKTISQNFNGNKTADTLGYLILQQRAAAETTVTINSIKITYPLDIDDGFDLVLDKEGSANVTTITNTGRTAATAISVTDGVLSATFAGDQFLPISLTEEQVITLFGVEAVEADPDATPPVEAAPAIPGAESFYITIWGTTETGASGNFRYFLGDVNENTTWNATNTPGDLAFESLATTKAISLNTGFTGAKILDFVLQGRTGTAATVNISRVRIDYKLKLPPDTGCSCADEDCSDDPFMIGCTGNCPCPKPGTPLANLNSIMGFQNAGSPKFIELDDGGLFIYDRGASYFAIDLDIVDLANYDPEDDDNPTSPENWEIGIDGDTNYRIKVTGKAVVTAPAVNAEIMRTNRPYSDPTNIYASAPVTGTAGQVGTYTVQVDAIKGSDIFYRFDKDSGTDPEGTDITDTTDKNKYNSIRIRLDSTAPYIIDYVEIYSLKLVDDDDDPLTPDVLVDDAKIFVFNE